jgi:TonB family protein
MLESHVQMPAGQGHVQIGAGVVTIALHLVLFFSLVVVWHHARIGVLGDVAGVRSAMPTFVMPAAAPAPPTPAPAPKPAPAEKPAPSNQSGGASALTADASQPSGPVRLQPGDQYLLKKVAPPYPPIMLSARIEGVVVLDATILRDGTIGDVKVLQSSGPAFEQAAVRAVKQWRYTPLPYEAILTVTVNFKLA